MQGQCAAPQRSEARNVAYGARNTAPMPASFVTGGHTMKVKIDSLQTDTGCTPDFDLYVLQLDSLGNVTDTIYKTSNYSLYTGGNTLDVALPGGDGKELYGFALINKADCRVDGWSLKLSSYLLVTTIVRECDDDCPDTAQFCPGGYRFGFNGQEKDNEVYGEGNAYSAEYWEYDPRLGRRWNVDPMFVDAPWQSPYSVFNNNPLNIVDPTGAWGEEPQKANVQEGDGPSVFAKRNNITLDQLAKYNPDVFKNYDKSENKSDYWENKDKNWKLYPDQSLNISDPFASQNTEHQTPLNYSIGADQQSAGGKLPIATGVGISIQLLTLPVPKRFIMDNSSRSSSIFSHSLSKAFPKKINFYGQRRLYTHTVNGTARYAATWGRFLGRWGTRAIPYLGWALFAYDVYVYRREIRDFVLFQQEINGQFRFRSDGTWNTEWHVR